MATQPGPISFHVGIPASADLSSYQYYFCEITTGALTVCNAAGDFAVGVLQNKPTAAGREADVVIFGPTKLVAGEAITAGNLITTSNAGKAMVCTPIGAVEANSAILGRALEDASGDGAIFGAWVNCINPGPAV